MSRIRRKTHSWEGKGEEGRSKAEVYTYTPFSHTTTSNHIAQATPYSTLSVLSLFYSYQIIRKENSLKG